MGRRIRNGIDYSGGGGGASDARDLLYDNTTSGLSASNAQDAIDEISNELQGIMVSVIASEWVETDGVYTNTIAVDGITENNYIDVYLYDDGTVSEEIEDFYNDSVTTVESGEGVIIVTATEALDIDFVLLVKGNMEVTVDRDLTDVISNIDEKVNKNSIDIEANTNEINELNTNVATNTNAISELNNALVGFIDVSNRLYNVALNDVSEDIKYTATEDCYFLVRNWSTETSGLGAMIKLDGIEIAGTLNTTGAASPIFPLKKGQTVSFNSYVRGALTVYKMIK